MKGITIFCVVFGHCIQYGNGSEFLRTGAFFDDIAFRVIYSFHMPLFALVSGYLFFRSASRRSLVQLFRRQLSIFVLPSISWAVLFYGALMIWHVYSGKFRGINFYTLHIFNSFLYNLWFLWAMFWSSVAVMMSRKFFHDSIIFHVAIIIINLFAPTVLGSTLYIFVYPYFVAGYIFNREGMAGKIRSLSGKVKFMSCAGIIILWCIMLIFFDRSSYIYTTGIRIFSFRKVELNVSQLYIDLFRWLIGFVGCCAVMIIAKFLEHVRFLAYAGKMSLGIYIMSGYIISHVITRIPADYAGYVNNFVEAVVITVLCCWLSFVISRVKFLNTFLLGGR